jgi:hypothetical protein
VRMLQLQATENVTEVRLNVQPARRVLYHYRYGSCEELIIITIVYYLISFTSGGQAA